MFSGIVEELGTVGSIYRRGQLMHLGIKASKVIEGTKIGDSIAVNGCCLTVTKTENNCLWFEVMAQTQKNTVLGQLRLGQKVNLERSLRLGDRISGHFVLGHIDCIGTIRRRSSFRGNVSLEIAVPSRFLNWVIAKGSVSIDGVSLTIAEKKQTGFCVFLIPHTLENTTLGQKHPSEAVNIEFDILVKKASPANVV
ncbi:MAG: riboflavin synthase [Candidatus Omnitrophica bacterium]|nr:riboflavin synthase [Candidatus Omnitrophota bacterium]